MMYRYEIPARACHAGRSGMTVVGNADIPATAGISLGLFAACFLALSLAPSAAAQTAAAKYPIKPIRVLVPSPPGSGIAGYELRSWYGLVAPKKTPPALILTLNQAVAAVMTSLDVKERLAADGAEAATANTPEEFRTLIATEITRWSAFLKRAAQDRID